MSSKRGLCWPVDNPDPLFTFTKPGSRITWLYNWSPSPQPPPGSLAFVPMAWNDAHLPQLRETLLRQRQGADASERPSSSSSRQLYALGFNEPDLASQARMAVAAAVQHWLRAVEPLRRELGVRVGSPAVASNEDGIAWLLAFVAGIRAGGGDVDFWCMHWYGETLGQFYDYIWSTHHRLGPDKPVWITEYACTNWSIEAPLAREHVEAFARESAAYLDSLVWVERYCWFGAMRDAGTVGRWARMLDEEGRLTPLGKAYRDG